MSFRILSIVGSIVSVEISEEIRGDRAASPTNITSWITFDLHKTGEIAHSYQEDGENIRNALLTDYFAEKDILAALLANAGVAASLREANMKAPDQLKDLLGDGKYLAINDSKTHQLNGYSLNKFVFERVTKDQVIVALEILDAYNTHKTTVTRIELILPIPETIRSALMKANNREEGFLGDVKIVDGKQTTFRFRSH